MRYGMDDYFNAKTELINQLKKSGVLLVNADNEWGQQLIAAQRANPEIALRSYGIDDKQSQH